jgi:hypothetical protein
MWVFLNDSMLSIVAPDQAKLSAEQKALDLLMVRARFQGDIERVFPEAAVEATAPGDFARDYAFRTLVPRKAVEDAMVGEVRRITYGNFKGSTQEDWRHDVYMRCWTPMKAEQDRRRPKAARRALALKGGSNPADPFGDWWEKYAGSPVRPEEPELRQPRLPMGKGKAKGKRKGGRA